MTPDKSAEKSLPAAALLSSTLLGAAGVGRAPVTGLKQPKIHDAVFCMVRNFL
jgi:hypothetical protein